jgi:hypothetical protein
VKTSRLVSLGLPFVLVTTGCVHTFGTPSLKHGVAPFRTGPNVAALVTHLNCEIAMAIYESTPRAGVTLTPTQSTRHELWQRLRDQNFVATVDFTLTATNSEGFNPSVSWITPLTSAGKLISAIPSTPENGGQTTGTTLATYNRTLAVGIQANGTQDRNFDLTYLIDLHRLYEAVQQEVQDRQAAASTHKSYPDALLSEICTDPGTGSETSLDGNLALAETIDFGLEGLDKGKNFEYGAEGPVPRPAAIAEKDEKEVTEPQKPSEPSNEASTKEFNLAPTAAAVGGAGGAKTSMGPQSTNTTFSSKMDFTIIQGASGGPSWQLLKWNIGAGASGGGAGASGGGAGGSGAGSSAGSGSGAGAGGGGSQFLNWSRTVMDTLTITFAPTCSSVQSELELGDGQPWTGFLSTHPGAHSPPPDRHVTYLITGPTLGTPDTNAFKAIVSPDPPGGTSPHYIRVNQTSDRLVYGSIQWRGFAEDRSGAGEPRSSFELLGTVSDPVTTNPVGAVVLAGTFVKGTPVVKSGHVTGNLYAALSSGGAPSDYWGSLQSCDLSSNAQIQNAVKNASDTNTLFRLTNADRQRLQQ